MIIVARRLGGVQRNARLPPIVAEGRVRKLQRPYHSTECLA